MKEEELLGAEAKLGNTLVQIIKYVAATDFAPEMCLVAEQDEETEGEYIDHWCMLSELTNISF